jgi:hypothetical protein
MRASAAFWLPWRCSDRMANNHMSAFFTTLSRPCSNSARALVLRQNARHKPQRNSVETRVGAIRPDSFEPRGFKPQMQLVPT